jgi:hypothetical protein
LSSLCHDLTGCLGKVDYHETRRQSGFENVKDRNFINLLQATIV